MTPNAQGLYSTQVGDDPGNLIPTSIFDTDNVWLKINVAGEDLSPRLRVTSSGFTFRAENANNLGGQPPSNYATDAELSTGLAGKANTSHAHDAADLVSGSIADGRVPAAIARDAEIFPTVLANDGSGSTLDADLLDGLNGSAYATDTELSTGLAVKANTADLIDSLPRNGAAYVIVKTTDNAASNGVNLFAAYAQAKALTPHGQALSATNRAVVLVAPGRYDLGTGQLAMDTEFVDLVGLSSARDDQYIFGATAGTGTGVLHQTADNVRIENLLVQSTRSTGTLAFNSSDPAAYFPDSDKPATVIRNCEFRDDGGGYSFSMRVGIIYSGAYSDCVGGVDAFGGFGTASGTFTNCTGGNNAFGKSGTASGIFTNCAGGNNAFGESGTASGTFTNCSAGYNAFGGGGTASGTFTNCSAGSTSFGGFATASGTFTDCSGGYGSFGASTVSGIFTNCTGTGPSFGGSFASTVSGTFTNCTGGDAAFGGNSGNTTGAKLLGCRMTGTLWSGTFSGRMENCFWGKGFTCDANARIYGSIIAGQLDLNSTAAGVTGTCAQNIINEANNVFGATSALALNLEDPDVN
ncbi:MAG: hypothetical protein V2A74_06755 [bacterium]